MTQLINASVRVCSLTVSFTSVLPTVASGRPAGPQWGCTDRGQSPGLKREGEMCLGSPGAVLSGVTPADPLGGMLRISFLDT